MRRIQGFLLLPEGEEQTPAAEPQAVFVSAGGVVRHMDTSLLHPVRRAMALQRHCRTPKLSCFLDPGAHTSRRKLADCAVCWYPRHSMNRTDSWT